jgi:hypothetical protein
LLFFPTPSHANLTEDITTKFTTIPMAVAGVRTVKGVDQWFDAATQVCTSFSHCRSWANSNRVMWRAVPAAISIWYYADDDCKGKIVYTTNPSLASGTAILTSNPTGVAIKSLMAVGHSMYPLKGVISECYYSLNAVVEHGEVLNGSTAENASSSEESTSLHGSTFEPIGNMSENWYESLPSTSN